MKELDATFTENDFAKNSDESRDASRLNAFALEPASGDQSPQTSGETTEELHQKISAQRARIDFCEAALLVYNIFSKKTEMFGLVFFFRRRIGGASNCLLSYLRLETMPVR